MHSPTSCNFCGIEWFPNLIIFKNNYHLMYCIWDNMSWMVLLLFLHRPHHCRRTLKFPKEKREKWCDAGAVVHWTRHILLTVANCRQKLSLIYSLPDKYSFICIATESSQTLHYLKQLQYVFSLIKAELQTKHVFPFWIYCSRKELELLPVSIHEQQWKGGEISTSIFFFF